MQRVHSVGSVISTAHKHPCVFLQIEILGICAPNAGRMKSIIYHTTQEMDILESRFFCLTIPTYRKLRAALAKNNYEKESRFFLEIHGKAC